MSSFQLRKKLVESYTKVIYRYFHQYRGANVPPPPPINRDIMPALTRFSQSSRSFWTKNNRTSHNTIQVFVPSRRDGYQRFNNNNNSTRTYKINGYILLFSAGGTLIWVQSRQEIPYTNRKHSILIDAASERNLGAQTFQEIVSDAKRKGTLLHPNHPASLAVRRVGTRIAAVAGDGYGGGYQDHMKGLHWDFAVIKSPEVNAFVVPGGHVVVYTGLLQMIKNEDELAAVLAHEAAHVLARHAAERMTQGSVMELLRFMAFWGLGVPIPQGPLVAMFFLPNSRKAETEADIIGMQLAARACYDPAASISVFTKLGEAERRNGGFSIPKFLRTHPVSGDRIKIIQKQLAKAKMLGEGMGCDGYGGGRMIQQELEDSLSRIGKGGVRWTTVLDSVT